MERPPVHRTALPFGLRSAPKVFNALADGLAWELSGRGIKVLHYLDDFLLVGKPEECDQALSGSLTYCAKLGVPIAEQKTEDPVAKLVFLGIETFNPMKCKFIVVTRKRNSVNPPTLTLGSHAISRVYQYTYLGVIIIIS